MNDKQATRRAVKVVLDKFFETGAPGYRIVCIRVSPPEPKIDGGDRRYVHASLEARGYIASGQEVTE